MSDAAAVPEKSAFEQRVSALVAKPVFWAVFVGVLALYPFLRALRHPVPKPPSLELPLAAFTLTDQRGRSFGSEDLKGKVWVADFVFTTCPVVCPKLTKRMAEIQHRARHLGQAFHLVTITVDPENDTPQVLQKYATSYHADPSRWSFLTGNLGEVETTIVKGFKIAMGREPLGDASSSGADSNLFSIFHGEKLVLVDQDGKIRGYYDADDAGIDELLRVTEILVNTR